MSNNDRPHSCRHLHRLQSGLAGRGSVLWWWMDGMDDHDDNDDCNDDDDNDGRWLWLWTVCILVLWWWYDDSHW
jgi:hypothetical protein